MATGCPGDIPEPLESPFSHKPHSGKAMNTMEVTASALCRGKLSLREVMGVTDLGLECSSERL